MMVLLAGYCFCKGKEREMSRVLELCKVKLATQRKSDNESLRHLIREIARELKVSITETTIDKAIVYLKYGKAVW